MLRQIAKPRHITGVTAGKVPVLAMTAYEAVEEQLHQFLTSALGVEWSDIRPGRFDRVERSQDTQLGAQSRPGRSRDERGRYLLLSEIDRSVHRCHVQMNK